MNCTIRNILKIHRTNTARGLKEKVKAFSAKKLKDEMDAWTPRSTPRQLRRLFLADKGVLRNV